MDDMKLLEQRAEQLAAEAERDQPPRAQSKIFFVRSDASREELAELAQQANPEEIQLGEEEDEEEMDLEPNGQWPELGRVKSRGGPSLPSLSHPHLDLTFPPQKSNWNSRLCQLLCSGA